MRLRMVVLFALAIAVSPASVAAPRLKEPADAKLPGTWRMVQADFDGVDITKGNLNHWVVTGDSITIVVQGSNRGVWTYRLDKTKKPWEIDLTTTAGGKPVTYPCIYKIEDDQLTLCLQNFPHRGRPTQFEAPPDSSVVKYVYARAKPGDEKAHPKK
jgi:uncharacterized protein (TIGR03067 family)